MAKSYKTSLVRCTNIEGATTLLCAPSKKSTMINNVERLKKGWFIREAKNKNPLKIEIL